ncbi:MAG: NAD-dependent epimerase/dehydratase family protein, partial [Pseudomonadales bacterium]
VQTPEEDSKGYRIVQTEQAVFAAIGHATHFRYPFVYGPYQPVPREWCIVRRIRDQRPFIILPDGGLSLHSYGYAENLAHAILLAADNPNIAQGQIYNCADEECLSLYQVTDVISKALDHSWEIVCLPQQFALPALPLQGQPQTTHRLLDISKIKQQLGYRDIVKPSTALARTAQWLMDHPPQPDGMEEMVLQDPFDYTAENAIFAAWQTLSANMPDASVFAKAPQVGMAYSGPGGRERSQTHYKS